MTASDLSALLNIPTFTVAAFLGKFPPSIDKYYVQPLTMVQIIDAIIYFGNHAHATRAARITLRMLATGTLRFTSCGKVTV